jgi:hypothetical protein
MKKNCQIAKIGGRVFTLDKVVWFFWTGSIVNLEARYHPCEMGSLPRRSLLRTS